MTRKQVDEIIRLALDVNGLEARRQGVSGNLPTAFINMSGHVALLNIRVYQKGFRDNGTPSDFDFWMDDEVDDKLLRRYKRMMRRLLGKARAGHEK